VLSANYIAYTNLLCVYLC